MQFYQVEFRAVAFVLAEAIFRETRAEVAHNRVPRDFRDHARGGDAEAVAIPVDDRGLREREGEHGEAIDEDVLRLKGQAGNGCAHRLVGRAQNVDRVDLNRIDDANGPRDGVVREELVIDFFTLLRQKLFRIVQLSMPKFLRKNNRRGYDWSRERAAPRFIDARDSGDPESAELAFMPETTTPIHRQQNTEKLKN
jgi:hypothetical protein